MYCKECGTVIEDNAVFCSNCGKRVKEVNGVNTEGSISNDDSESIGFAIAGFLVPIAGFVLWLIERKERPKKAKSAGIGALVRLGINFVVTVILVGGYLEILGSFLEMIVSAFIR